MNLASQRLLPVSRGPYQLHAEVIPGTGVPVMLMHGFPDNTHLYDRLLPHLAGHRPVVLFDFLGWGHSDKPVGYPYTAANQAGDLAAVVGAVDEHFGPGQLVLVAHDASGPPAIDWALDNPGRVATLVLLNTYYHWIPALRRLCDDDRTEFTMIIVWDGLESIIAFARVPGAHLDPGGRAGRRCADRRN